jgi:hypothetical protein
VVLVQASGVWQCAGQQLWCVFQVPAVLSSWLCGKLHVLGHCLLWAALHSVQVARCAAGCVCWMSRRSSAVQQVGWAWWYALWLDCYVCQAPAPAGWLVSQAPSGQHDVCVVVSAHLQKGGDAEWREQCGPGRARALCGQWSLLASAQLDLLRQTCWGRRCLGFQSIL